MQSKIKAEANKEHEERASERMHSEKNSVSSYSTSKRQRSVCKEMSEVT